MSLVLFSAFAAGWFFIPVQHSHADSVKTETWSSSSGMASPPSTEYQYKREQSETHMNGLPGTEEKRTEVQTERRSDADLAPPATSEYQYKSESRESTQVAPPPPQVVERDRTIIEHDAPPPPREGRLQAWWHRNFHRDAED